MILEHLEPQPVFRYFEELSRIPRGSGNEKAASDYAVAFAREHGLEVMQDASFNVIIRKPGTAGYENRPPLILQGHLDMVNEKNKDTVHDFTRDPIRLLIDGDFVRAEGTTLGADNGVAVAPAMALLADKTLTHPPLEALFTADEEAGMSGAENLDMTQLTGKRMINLDTAREGTFYAGCASGGRVVLTIPAVYSDITEDAAAVITVKGLRGGHSGADIDCGRGNSLRLLGRILHAMNDTAEYRVVTASGGMKSNAIPREASATLVFNARDKTALRRTVEQYAADFTNEYRLTDPGVRLTFETLPALSGKAMARENGRALADALLLLPNGPQSMSRDVPGLVETSCSIGVLTVEGDIVLEVMPRGLVATRLYAVKAQISRIAALTGGKIEFLHEHPAWAFNPDSPLREAAVACYREMYGSDPIVTAVHAGLECSIFAGKLPELDMLSFGPDAYDAHNPDERLSVSSTARVWSFLKELLKRL